MADRDLYSGLILLHILHHVLERAIFGLVTAEELARHGFACEACTSHLARVEI
jgi:hypothetical protein